MWFLAAEVSGVARYWHNFWDYWRHTLLSQNGIVTCTVLFGMLGIFIITRGKWRK
jgi:hypothetical protein